MNFICRKARKPPAKYLNTSPCAVDDTETPIRFVRNNLQQMRSNLSNCKKFTVFQKNVHFARIARYGCQTRIAPAVCLYNPEKRVYCIAHPVLW
jgi:hypothetical protein